MPATITQKILSRVAGRPVQPGENVRVNPDFVLGYAFAHYSDMYLRMLSETFGRSTVVRPDRLALFIDHNTPAIDPVWDEVHKKTRVWCKENGVALYDRRGIGHLVASEVGYAVPGAFAVHFDGHVSQLGAFGALAMGLRLNWIECLLSEHIPITVPGTALVSLRGRLREGMMARDALHHIIKVVGADGCNSMVMELGGDGLDQFSLGDIQAIAGQAMFTGAVSAIANPSPAALKYSASRAKADIAPVYSDPDASYSAVYEIDLGEVEPTLVVPPNPANTQLLSEHVGLRVDLGYIGSCASGRIEDLRMAARVLENRSVAKSFALNVVPSSVQIAEQARQEGILGVLANAGAIIGESSCNFCYGAVGVLKPGQRAVSTGTLNVPGRMGSTEAEIFLCSAATVAASALEGRIADPRKYLGGSAPV